MDPNDQNQQQPTGMMSSQPTQDMAISQQPLSDQPTYQVGGQQVTQEPPMAGPAPMPEEPEKVGDVPFAAEPLVPDTSQPVVSESGVVQPSVSEVSQTQAEQVNPVDQSVQYGTGEAVSPESQVEEGGGNNSQQGV